MSTLFELRGMTWKHPSARPDPKTNQVKPTLRDVDLIIPNGSRIGILGQSGCGKTTLLQVLSLLWEEECVSGSIVCTLPDAHGRSPVNYRDIKNRDSRAFYRSSHFGFVLQNAFYLRHLSVISNIALPLEIQGVAKAKAEETARGLLSHVTRDQDDPLVAGAHRAAEEFSLGQRQRLAVLRAISPDPAVVFADEPTANLDHKTSAQVVKLLRDWQEGKFAPAGSAPRVRTLIMVTHKPQELLDSTKIGCDFLIGMSQGIVRAVKQPNRWGLTQCAFRREPDMTDTDLHELLGDCLP